MRKVLVGTVAALGLVVALSGTAMAVEVVKDVEVKAAPADVWKKIGGWCSIRNWHPAIKTCQMSQENGATMRLLTTQDGAEIMEQRTAESEMSYDYTITKSPLPISNYSATIGVAPDDDGDETKITWKANFDANGASDEDAQKVIEGIFESGLAAIKDSMAQ